MNIFYLSEDPKECAQFHCNKHVVKMILEYSQIMSGAHRILDGEEITIQRNGRKVKQFFLSDSRDSILYKATHNNHKSCVWCRESSSNYIWLYKMWVELCKEYTYRYGKIHSSTFLLEPLKQLPKNIPKGKFTEPPPAMPEEYKVKFDSISSYKNYYNKDKIRFAKWTKREVPYWMENLNESNALCAST